MFSDSTLSTSPGPDGPGWTRKVALLAPVVWTLVIAWLSSSRWGAATTAGYAMPALRWLWPGAADEQLVALHWLLRKAGHVVEYATLAALWSWALGGRDAARRWAVPFALAVLTGGLDELHQASTAGRTGSVSDVLLDAAAAGGALIARGGGRSIARRLTGAFLWLAAAGGTALIVLDWIADVPAGWLWFTVPVSWLALALWNRDRRRP